MTAKEWIQWNDSFSLGIPLIDEQHKQLIMVTNQLYSACNLNDRSAAAQFRVTVKEAVAYVKYHFATEEQIMQRVRYPYYELHKLEHGEFIQEILVEIQNFKEGKKFVPNLFVRFLRDWVLSHIAKTDSHLGKYLVQLQEEGKLRSITIQPKTKTSVSGS